MKKLFGLMLLATAVALSACKKDDEKLPTIQFETNNAFLNPGTDLVLKVVLSEPAASAITIPYNITGAAVKGTDFSVEESAFEVAAGASESTVTFKHLSTAAEAKNFSITISAVSGYSLGNKSTCIVSVGPKEDVIWSFARSTASLIQGSEVTVKIVLRGEYTGSSYVAPSAMTIPFTVKSTSTAAATDYSVKDNATAFTIPGGKNEGTITLTAGDFDAGATPAKFVDLTLNPGTGFIEGDRPSIKITLSSFTGIQDIVGEWAYDSFIITDDEDAALDLLEMLVDPDIGGSGDDLELLPKHNTPADKFTIALDGTDYKLTPSMTGDIANYFRTATISGGKHVAYNFYYLDDTETPNFDATECTLSSVNKKFSKTEEQLGEAKFKFYLAPDGNTLYVFITDYIPTDFLNLMYTYDDGGIYFLFPYLFDMGYVFSRVTE